MTKEKEAKTDLNDYKMLYGELRNEIVSARDKYNDALIRVKQQIITKTNELEILKVQMRQLEGALEASEILTKVRLPSNNKANGEPTT